MMSMDEVKHLIQRWRDIPEEELKPDDYQQFRELGSSCLAQGSSAQLLKFLQDDKNQGIVKLMGCELLEPLTSEIVGKEQSADECHAALTHLTKTCSPNKLLHTLLELIEHSNPGAISETIMVLLPHLQTVLLGLDAAQAASLGLAVSAIQKQLSLLPVPYSQQQEQADEYGLCRCCTAVAAFTKPFIHRLKHSHTPGPPTTQEEQLRTELLNFCMRSLREPLLQAQLTRDRKSPLQLFALEIVTTLPAIHVSLAELLFFSTLKKSSLMDTSESKESRACLSYLLFVQLLSIDSFPAVFSSVFVLQCNMEYVHILLSSKHESHLLKGLALYSKSLEFLQDNSLPVSLLDLKVFHSVSQALCHVLTDCPMQHLRQTGLQVFQLLINKLDVEAKHKFFRCTLKTSNHPGVEGYIVKNIRNQVDFSMKLDNSNAWFLGEDFLPLLGLVLCLTQGAETDLLHNMDRIMECLNLLRYLLLRDKELRRQRHVWDELCRMKDEYLKLLRVCISMSTSHYRSELKVLREDQRLKAKDRRAASGSTALVKSIRGKHETVSNMSPEVQQQVLQSALVTFGLMESLIVRIEEIAEEKLKSPN